MSWVRAFGRFWYDFIVGDSVVLAIGAVSLLVAGWLFVSTFGTVSAEFVLPLAVAGTLAWSAIQRD